MLLNIELNQKQQLRSQILKIMTEIISTQHQLTPQTLLSKYKDNQAQLQSSLHEHKKSLLEAKTELQFERNRANQFEEKYKSSIRYQNEEKQLKKLMNELDNKLTEKQNEMLDLLKQDQQRKKKISQLHANVQQLQTRNLQLQEKVKQMGEGAISAILQKEGVINELQEKIQQYEEAQNNNKNLADLMVQLQERYKQLEQRHQGSKIELEGVIQGKQQEIRDLFEKSQHQKQKLQERITRLEQEVADYEKHIEHLNEQKNQQESIQEKFYVAEEKLRKSQKRVHQLQLLLGDIKKEYEEAMQKFSTQDEDNRNLHDQVKSFKQKIKDLEKGLKEKQKTIQDSKNQNQKKYGELNKKISHTQQQRKKTLESIEVKNLQIQRLRLELQERNAEVNEYKNAKNNSTDKNADDSRSSLASQIQTIKSQQIGSPSKLQKKQSQQYSRQIQKLKADIKDLEENNQLLGKKLGDQIKENRQMRQRLVSESGSASMSQGQEKLLRTVQDLNGHIKKVQNSLMINKLKYAEDQSYWSMKEKNYKQQLEANMRQFKKQKSQLLERIDRMKKNTVKDKKMDYYQSAFK